MPGELKGYWTSTDYENDTSQAWTVDFTTGGIWGYGKTNKSYARCVRNEAP